MTSSFMLQDSYVRASQEDRCVPRCKIAIPAMLRMSGSKGFQTVIHDLSPAGFSAQAINKLHPQSICWLTLPGLESLQAEVIWWNNSVVGCAFMSMLNPIVHDTLIARWRRDGVYRAI